MLLPIVEASSEFCPGGPAPPSLDLVEEPAAAIAHLLAGGLYEILGPFFWAALVAGFVFAEFAAG
jgi:hypothetical protein